jgi:hypothetical protein
LKEPTEDEEKINITLESKKKTLRNIVEVLDREDKSGEEHKLSAKQRRMLQEIKSALQKPSAH